ncbi:YlqD family protein [Salimicrobium sp. PL1-032A]|uniref:YlqD family protein n=1 Tax=Salimicrobium sp. PL1-032A TaxID=3095364 RepID=UPI003260367E
MKKVPVKVILTENERNKQKQRLQDRRRQLETEKEQLHFEKKKLERKHGALSPEIEQRMSGEMKQREQKVEAVDYQLDQLDILPENYELTIEEVDSMVDIEEGMVWDTTKNREIVIEDGVIKRVRDE